MEDDEYADYDLLREIEIVELGYEIDALKALLKDVFNTVSLNGNPYLCERIINAIGEE